MRNESVMQTSTLNDGTGELIRLPTVLDLAAAENFLTTVRSKLDEGERVLRLDASGVETLTLPCIQIILAAIRSHARVSVVDPSAEFVAAFGDLGLDWRRGNAAVPAIEPTDIPLPAMDPTPAPAMEISPEPAMEALPDPATDPLPEQAADAGAEPVGELAEVCEQASGVMKKRILTIDDSKTMRDMLMVTLADAGFDVIQGVDGQDGLDTLGDGRVDVVITDINMPKMDGYEVIRQLRRNPVHKTTPILVLTTESDREKRGLAREAGATGWMVKPFDPDQLVATIRKVSP